MCFFDGGGGGNGHRDGDKHGDIEMGFTFTHNLRMQRRGRNGSKSGCYCGDRNVKSLVTLFLQSGTEEGVGVSG